MRGRLFAALLVVALAITVLLPNAPDGRRPSEDAGVFFYAARVLLSGGTPYLDVWDHKTPFVYVVDAVGLAAADRAGVWVLQMVALALAAVIGLRAMARSFGLWPATFGTFAWLLASPRLFLEDGEQTSFVELYALPLQFAALALASQRLDMRIRRRDAIAIGALGALALMLKPTLVGVWLAILVVVFGRARSAALPSVFWSAVGGAVAVAPFVVFLWSRGALDAFLDQTVHYNVAYAAFAPLVERLGAIPEGVRLLSPSGLAPLALATALYAIVRRYGDPLLVIAIVALPIEMLLATSGRAYHYYFLAWLPAMGVLAGFAATEARATLRWLAPAVVGVALVLMAIQPARLVWRLAETRDDGGSRAAAAYLRERTGPQDRVLVWGSHAEVLILADRRSPSRLVYQYAPLATRGYGTPASIDSFLADLASRPPAYIVDSSSSSFVTPPLDRAGMRAWVSPEAQYAWPPETDRIAAFVEGSYVREGSLPVSGWPVYRRR